MKVLAVLLAVLAVLIGVLPQFTDCQSQGRLLTLEDGRQIPMKCHWAARAEVVAGAPLFAVGVMLFLSRRKEARLFLYILGIILGVLVMLIPTLLIGVCTSADMLCNSFMQPALIIMGSAAVGISIFGTVSAALQRETAPPS